MHRIDDATAIVIEAGKNGFTVGNPTTGVPATKVSDSWLNDLQETVANFIEAQGITLAKDNYTQLIDAFKIASEDTTSQVVLGNNVAAVAVTGLLFDPTLIVSANIAFDVYRKDDTQEVVEHVFFKLRFKPVAQVWETIVERSGDATGVSFSFSVDGSNVAQIEMTSDNYAGAGYIGELRFKVQKFKI